MPRIGSTSVTEKGADSVSADPRNVIIIGSGPAGYTAAVYAARANLAPLVFEGSVTAGGALMNTTEVENFPGFRDGIQGPQLMDEMRAQAERFGAELVSDDVISVELEGDVKTVRTEDGTFTARTVILSMGSGYRKLGMPGGGPALRPRRQLVRDLRRLLLPRAAHRGRGRRRLRDRGGDVPVPLRLQGHLSSTAATSCVPPRSCRSARSPTPRSSSPGTPRSPRSTATTS